jgi:ABC-type multidrug transport system fused ATPase/permease subunit
MISQLRRRHTTVVVVSHRIGMIHMADMLLVMDAKRRSRFGRPDELFAQNLRPVATQRSA